MEKEFPLGFFTLMGQAAAGLVLVLAMSHIYQSTIIPAWTSAFTPVSFVAAYLVLGGGLLLLTLPRAATSVVGIAAAAGLVGVVSQLVALPFYLAELGNGSAFARQALAVLTGEYGLVLWGSVLLLVLAPLIGTMPRLARLWADGGYAGQLVAWVREQAGWEPEVVKLSEAKRGFVVLPKRWIVERAFAGKSRFRRLVRDYERRLSVLAGLHFVAFACLELARAAPLLHLAQSS